MKLCVKKWIFFQVFCTFCIVCTYSSLLSYISGFTWWCCHGCLLFADIRSFHHHSYCGKPLSSNFESWFLSYAAISETVAFVKSHSKFILLFLSSLRIIWSLTMLVFVMYSFSCWYLFVRIVCYLHSALWQADKFRLIELYVVLQLGFLLLALIWKFDFSPFMILVIAILNDGKQLLDLLSNSVRIASRCVFYIAKILLVIGIVKLYILWLSVECVGNLNRYNNTLPSKTYVTIFEWRRYYYDYI